MIARPPHTWTGAYFDGRSATRHPVTVAVLPDGLRILCEDAPPLWWRHQETRLTQGAFPGEHVRLERGVDSVETLVVSDPGFYEHLQAVRPRPGRLGLGSRRVNWILVGLGAGAAAVALGLLAYLWVIPGLADMAAARMPPAWEERLGMMVLEHLAPPEDRCEDSQRLAAIERIVGRLAAASESLPYAVKVHVVDDPTVNAFAAPGGFIVVHSGLVRVTRSPEELAGVLAHEISHVIHRHGTRALIRELSLRALIAIATGNVSGLEQAIGAAGKLGGLRYRRADELQADREAVILLAESRIDPEGLIRFLERVRDDSPGLALWPEYLSTHPAPADRIAVLRRAAAARSSLPERLLIDYPWSEMTTICR